MKDKRPVIRVPKTKGEITLRKLKKEGRLDKERLIKECDSELVIPVTADGSELSDELQKKPPLPTPFERVKKAVDIPGTLKELLPSRWERIGDVLLIKLPSELLEYKDIIGAGYARVLEVKTVALQGDIVGRTREPIIKVIHGTDTETIHLENRVKFKHDIAKLMFSSGNIDERIHMSKIDIRDEIVVDMFAGIGYFCLPMAVHGSPKNIYALEINPTALGYLKENCVLNDVGHIVRPWPGDNRDFTLDEKADRVVMGYLHDTWKYLPKALEFLGGEGIIHFHTLVEEGDITEGVIMQLGKGSVGDAEIEDIRNIKSYAPRIYHIVADIDINP